jgi:large subunit ribosomal protein L6
MIKEDNKIILERINDDRKIRALHGLSRALVNNAVVGVKSGFEKKLEIQGVGYRAAKEGTALNLQLGYSHPVKVNLQKELILLLKVTQKSP